MIELSASERSTLDFWGSAGPQEEYAVAKRFVEVMMDHRTDEDIVIGFIVRWRKTKNFDLPLKRRVLLRAIENDFSLTEAKHEFFNIPKGLIQPLFKSSEIKALFDWLELLSSENEEAWAGLLYACEYARTKECHVRHIHQGDVLRLKQISPFAGKTIIFLPREGYPRPHQIQTPLHLVSVRPNMSGLPTVVAMVLNGDELMIAK